jgi:hypothetical protein
MKVTVYTCRQTKGLVELQRDILRLCPCEPSAATLYGLNYHTARHACAAVL